MSDNVVHDQQGMILRDNAFGTLQEDAFRRDFSVNALYYDPNTNEIIAVSYTHLRAHET